MSASASVAATVKPFDGARSAITCRAVGMESCRKAAVAVTIITRIGASVGVGAVVDGAGALVALQASASGIAGNHRPNRRMERVSR